MPTKRHNDQLWEQLRDLEGLGFWTLTKQKGKGTAARVLCVSPGAWSPATGHSVHLSPACGGSPPPRAAGYALTTEISTEPPGPRAAAVEGEAHV